MALEPDFVVQVGIGVRDLVQRIIDGLPDLGDGRAREGRLRHRDIRIVRKEAPDFLERVDDQLSPLGNHRPGVVTVAQGLSTEADRAIPGGNDMQSRATAEWQGDLMSGQGKTSVASGVFQGAGLSWKARTEGVARTTT